MMVGCRATLVVAIAFVFAFGLVMIFNTSSAEVLDLGLERSTHQALIRQILYCFLGCGVGYLLRLLGYRSLLRLSTPLLVLFSILLLLVLVPGVGIEANGARRWLGFGGYTLQPSEFVKLVVPLFFIQHVVALGPERLTFRQFILLVGTAALPMVLVVLEPNNGTVAIIGSTLVVLFVVTGIRFKFWALPMLIAVLFMGVTAYNMPYVSGRLSVYLHPELDLLGKGHQPHQAKIAAGSGGIMGVGPGRSIQKLSYLPEAQNDYIAAIYAEEFGFIGILALISLYMVIVYCGFHIACYAPDRQGCYLAVALSFLVGIQAFLNLGVVSGLLPSTGLNLPFFSQGGTSLMANLMAIGVLLDISRRGEQRLAR